MNFEKGHLFHVYNRGNNRNKIFFSKKNYFYFIKKIITYILPYCDLYAYCLMPNHFHIMLEVNKCEINGVTLNDSVGILLSSYAKAINKQEQRTGSLFQQKTKAVCLTKIDKLSPSWFKHLGITIINTQTIESSYPYICMAYIHNNPVKAGLVFYPEFWEYSSFRYYAKSIESKLINFEKGKEFFVGHL